jgi:superoxide dismutase
MKLVIIGLGLFVLGLLISCDNSGSPSISKTDQEGQKHEEHNVLRDNLAHKGIIILEKPYKASREFGQTIDTFYGSYLKLKNSLIKSDTIAANKAAQELKFILELVPEPAMKKIAADAWKNHKKGYNKNLTEFLQVKDIEEKRSYFSHVSEILYCTFKSFDLGIDNVHVAYCPMAFDNKGAYWLTESHEIRNPYFGNEMLKCGTIEEILH